MKLFGDGLARVYLERTHTGYGQQLGHALHDAEDLYNSLVDLGIFHSADVVKAIGQDIERKLEESINKAESFNARCPTCGWEEIERVDEEMVRCRRCNNRTDLYEAMKQYENHHGEAPRSTVPVGYRDPAAESMGRG